MRLWHEALIPYLPRQQLLGQHRECCALRGLGWGKKHATVDYVFQHPYGWLYIYHLRVMTEMQSRGYKVSPDWLFYTYRGKNRGQMSGIESTYTYVDLNLLNLDLEKRKFIYPEHDDAYLQECLDNLTRKGIKIDMEVKP